MKHTPPSHAKSKPGHPTLLGTLVFTVFNLIILSIVSWMCLEVWFLIKIIFLDTGSDNDLMRVILENNLHIIQNENIVSVLFSKFNYFKSAINASLSGYVDRNIIDVFLITTEIVCARIVIFIEWLPFMILMLGVLTIDGLVLRDKRKFQGARESTFVFHRLKPLATASFYSLFFIYMVIPYSISPFLFLFAMVTLSGWFIARSIKNFKKYL
jgi:hypothetical protein